MTGQDLLVYLHEDILKEIENMLTSIKALDPILDKLAKFPAEGPIPELKDEYDALVVAQLTAREKVKESETHIRAKSEVLLKSLESMDKVSKHVWDAKTELEDVYRYVLLRMNFAAKLFDASKSSEETSKSVEIIKEDQEELVNGMTKLKFAFLTSGETITMEH